MKITNNTRDPLDFVINGKAKDGNAPTATVQPGETADIDVVENAQFEGRVLAGAITVPTRTASKVEAAATDGSTKTR